MKQNKILKSKRGVAIETAVLFIIIILALCALITTFPLMQHYQTKIDIILLKQDIELEQITDHFLAFLGQTDKDKFEEYVPYIDKNGGALNGKYDYDVAGNTLAIKSQGGTNTLLFVRAEEGADGFVVASSKSKPSEEDVELGQITAVFLACLENDRTDFDNYLKEFYQGEDKIPEFYKNYKTERYGYSLLVKNENDALLFVRTGIITAEDGSQKIVLTDVQNLPSEAFIKEQQNIVDLVDLYRAGVKNENIMEILKSACPDYGYEPGNAPYSLEVKSDGDTILYIELDGTGNITKLLYSDTQATD